MKDIPLGVNVECTDGIAGQSTHVVLDPDTQKVTHFVVKNKDADEPNDWLVSVDAVTETTFDVIQLNLSLEEFGRLMHYSSKEFTEANVPDYKAASADPYYLGDSGDVMRVYPKQRVYASETKVNIPEGEIAIAAGTTVKATDGSVGKVGELLADPDTGAITHFTVREGRKGKKEVTLPVTAVSSTDADAIHLKLDKKTINMLPTVPVKKSIDEVNKVELFTILFPNESGKANEVLDFLKDMEKGAKIKVRNAAVIVKNADGTSTIKEEEEIEGKSGAIFGAITGGVIGLLGGPVGVVIGAAAGAGVGKVAADKIDSGFSNKYLERLQDHLEPNSSALLLLIEHQWAKSMVDSLADWGGVVSQETITDEMVKKILAQSEDGDK